MRERHRAASACATRTGCWCPEDTSRLHRLSHPPTGAWRDGQIALRCGTQNFKQCGLIAPLDALPLFEGNNDGAIDAPLGNNLRTVPFGGLDELAQSGFRIL